MAPADNAALELQELLDMGDDLQDAMDFLRTAATLLPIGADAATYIPSVLQAEALAPITDADLVVARRDWYVRDAVPQEFRLLLDARSD